MTRNQLHVIEIMLRALPLGLVDFQASSSHENDTSLIIWQADSWQAGTSSKVSSDLCPTVTDELRYGVPATW